MDIQPGIEIATPAKAHEKTQRRQKDKEGGKWAEIRFFWILLLPEPKAIYSVYLPWCQFIVFRRQLQ